MSAGPTEIEIFSLLKSLGLSEREARIYFALLSKGEKRASDISSSTGIPQPHVYSILKSARGKGVVEMLEGGAKKYRAVPLTLVIDRLIGEKERALVSLKKSSQEVAKKIQVSEKGVYIGELKPIIGKIDLEKRVIEMIQDAKKEILGIGTSSSLINHTEYLPFWRNLRSRGVKVRFLTKFDADKIEKIKPFIDAGTEIRFSNKWNISVKLIVDDEALFDVSFEEPEKPWDLRIWTNHKEIVKEARQRFEECWEKAKSLQEMIGSN